MEERIDAFSHVLPKSVAERLAAVNPSEALSNYTDEAQFTDVDKRLREMDEHGVDRQVINIAAPNLWYGISETDALEVTRFANDEIRRIADEHPDRFIPTGTLPFLTDAYLDELDRCLTDLELPGIQIFTNVNGRPLDDPAFRAFFERIDRSGVPLWLHPQLIESYDWIDDYVDHKMLGWPFDSTLAVSRLIFGGVLDDCRTLQVITHHAGGMLPLVGERMASFAQSRQEQSDMYVENVGTADEPVDHYFDQFYGDTALSVRHSPAAIRCALEFFGPDRLVFGVDYPFGPDEGRYWLEHTVEVLETMDLGEDTLDRIYRRNLRELIGA